MTLMIMSVLYSSDKGWYISHELFINQIYKNVINCEARINPDLFKIVSTYRTNSTRKSRLKVQQNEPQKQETVSDEVCVKLLCETFLSELKENKYLTDNAVHDEGNTDALTIANSVYKLTENIPQNIVGGNADSPLVTGLDGSRYLFPNECKFFGKNVLELSQHISSKYDLILLDPPWWNKYIRRKRKKGGSSYDMMYNSDLKSIPIETMLQEDGLVVVWCTNSQQHLGMLQNEIFQKWGVEFCAKWYWLKVTQSGESVCEFGEPTKKQPFEQIIFGCKNTRMISKLPNERIIVSVPSALHSHKPPLAEVLKPYLPPNPNCLELFARYLLPGWTSYGLEVLKFQHESLYNLSEKNICDDKTTT